MQGGRQCEQRGRPRRRCRRKGGGREGEERQRGVGTWLSGRRRGRVQANRKKDGRPVCECTRDACVCLRRASVLSVSPSSRVCM